MQTPLKANGIHHVGLRVTDIERSKQFYVEFLGMEVIQQRKRMVFLRLGDQMLTLSQTGNGQPVNARDGMDHLALRLEAGDYASVKALVEEAGHEIFGRRGDIYFADPDSYLLQIMTPDG